MNFERLATKIFTNWSSVRDKKKTLIFLKYHYHILKIKKQKLKLGTVAFEIRQHFYGEVPLMETMEMRYIRQDNTIADELKLENRLNALKWKWNFSNIGAFIIVFFIAFTLFKYYLTLWYIETFPAFAIREERYDILVDYTFTSVFSVPSFISIAVKFKAVNLMLINYLVNCSINFNLLF